MTLNETQKLGVSGIRDIALNGDLLLASTYTTNSVIPFAYDGASWGALTPLTDPTSTTFGEFVALDVNRAFITNEVTYGQWLVNVYTRSGSSLTFEGSANPDPTNGLSIQSLDASGTTIVVGDPYQERVLIVEYDGASWAYADTLAASDSPGNASFGYSVAIDGDVIAVGAPYDETTGGQGSAYVFRKINGAWVEQKKLLQQVPAPYDTFALSVDVEGDTVIAGAPYDDGQDYDLGTVQVFAWTGTDWEWQAELWPPYPFPEAYIERMGHAVSLSGDRLLAGNGDGAGVLFEKKQGGWSFVAALLPSGYDSSLGDPVELDGNTALLQGTDAYVYDVDAGRSCTIGAECSSGTCRDGVCCDRQCDGNCQTCSAALGAPVDGECVPLPLGEQGVPSCAPFACDGVSADCPSACSLDDHCDAGYCVDGGCVADHAAGEACERGTQCTTGYCADGVCCDSVCAGTCEACSAAKKGTGADGVCGPVVAGSDPDEECAADSHYPASCLADGACDGAGACRAMAVAGVACAPAVCSPPATLNVFECNGAGNCVSQVRSCSPYTCLDGESCGDACATDADCASGSFCDAGACVAAHAAGQACGTNAECISGYCVDGVCCDTACAGTCVACTAGRKGSGLDGVCGPVAEGTDPDDDCVADAASTCRFDGACNGSGACRLHAAGTACGDTTCSSNAVVGRVCDGAGTCALQTQGIECAPYRCGATGCGSVCADDAECFAGAFCDVASCRALKPNGEACDQAAECGSGNCADGVCCDAPCGRQCEACNSDGRVGECLPIEGAPRGGRAACAGSGTECGGSCDGVDASGCSYPASGTACGQSVCESGIARASACDGLGVCVDQPEVSCGAYACAAGACATSCSDDTGCAAGFACEGGTCVPSAGATCSVDLSESLGVDGSRPCAPYLCDPDTGRCGVSCSLSAECARGHVCDAKQCVEVGEDTAPIGDEGCGCRQARSHGSGVPWALMVGLAVAIAWWRRRRAARGGVAALLGLALLGCSPSSEPAPRTRTLGQPATLTNVERIPVAGRGNFRLVDFDGTSIAVQNNSEEQVLVRGQDSWVVQSSVETSGSTVAIDGSLLAFGNSSDSTMDSNAGAVYLYRRNGESWSKLQTLFASDPSYRAFFGSAVDIDGDRIVVGAADPLAVGSVYVFERSGDRFVEKAKITPDHPAAEGFGWAVAVDGDSIVVGASDGGTTGSGQVFLFDEEPTGWVQKLAFDPPGGNWDTLGWAVAVSGDLALAAAPWRGTVQPSAGAVFPFSRSGSSWVDEPMLYDDKGQNFDEFGYAVSLDGDAALVGVHGADWNGSDSGGGYLYRREGGAWVRQHRLSPAEPTSELGETADLVGGVAMLSEYAGEIFVFGVDAGAACSSDADCGSKSCRDGVCCDRRCDAPCETCAVAAGASEDGVCSPRPAGDAGDPVCAPYYCDGITGQCPTSCRDDAECVSTCISGGACASYAALGAACVNDGECLGGRCVSGVCCESACDGSCMACAQALTGMANGTCSPVSAGLDPGGDCVDEGSPACGTNGLCDGAGGCQTYPVGTGCTPNACSSDADCASGHCTDGICCDSSCDGTCEACTAARKGEGVDGECGLIVAGTDPDAECPAGAGYPATCNSDGNCDGKGRCRAYAPAGDSCGTPSCSSGSLTTQQCNGAGSCIAVVTSCEPFACADASSCGSSCSVDGDCASGTWCQLGVCVGRHRLGAQCTRGGECASGFCADGVCCDAACDGTCEACSADKKGFGSSGTCEPVRTGIDLDDECAATDPSTCGLDGSCDGRGACRFHAAGTACGSVSCSGGTARGSLCDGGGSCDVSASSVDCAPYACGSAGCMSSCASDADCAGTARCVGSECLGKLGKGRACSGAADCSSGFCVDGVCCDTACTGQCEACGELGFEGSCVPVQGAPRGSRAACAGEGTECAGSCTGVNPTSCGYPPVGTPCGTPSCSQGVALTSACDGAGACAEEPEHNCGGYTCDGEACGTSCSDGAGCVAGHRCQAGRCVLSSGGTCSDDRSKSLQPNGERGCAPYLCDPSTGDCLVACEDTADCTSGHVCDTERLECIAVVDTADDEGGGCGCALPGRRGSRHGALLLLFPLAWWVMRRRRHWPGQGLAAALAMLAASGCGSERGEPAQLAADAGAGPRQTASSARLSARSAQAKAIAATQRKADVSYALRGEPGATVQADNRAQGLRLQIGKAGLSVELQAAGHRLGLRTVRFGCAGSLEPVRTAALSVDGNHAKRGIEAAAGAAAREWWQNGPLGVEHGYVVPVDLGCGTRPVVFEIEVDGDLDLAATPSGEVVFAQAQHRPVLRYGFPHAEDASGEPLDVDVSVQERRIELTVHAAGASYPLQVDPLLYAAATKLVASDGAAFASVALTTDFLFAGAPAGAGAVYVFRPSAGSWVEQGKLVASDGENGDAFGGSLAVHGDTLAIGAVGDDDAGSNAGATYLFTRSGTTWAEQTKVSGEALQFGRSLAVYEHRLVVGAAGAAFVYHQSGSAWTQVASLAGTTNAFGTSVATHGSGVAVGQPATPYGLTYRYSEVGNYAQGSYLYSNLASGLGSSVALRNGLAAMGAPLTNADGAVYLSSRTITGTANTSVTASDGVSGDGFGQSVAMSDNLLAIGAYRDDDGALNAGSVYVFRNENGAWGHSDTLRAFDPTSSAELGSKVAMADATIAATTRYPSPGAIYVFAPVSGVSCTTTTCPAGTYCIDGFCCDAPCTGGCEACSVATGAIADGVCTLLADGHMGSPSCAPFSCDGVDPECPTACTSTTDCAAGEYCADGVCCDAACTGDCEACTEALGASADGKCTQYPRGHSGSPSCAPYVCNGYSDCPTSCSNDNACPVDTFCDIGSGTCQSKRSAGEPCAEYSQCLSTLRCYDGVCCDVACNQDCMACTAALKGYGVDGVCEPVRAGTDPKDDCSAGNPSYCGQTGVCDGAGACAKYPAGTLCDAPGCASQSEQINADTCDGAGNCIDNGTTTCSPNHACVETSCRDTCSSDGDCVAGAYCERGACVPGAALGQPCARDAQCTSGVCADGVCCDTACTEPCQACSQSKTGQPDGTCAAVTAGTDPNGDCSDDGSPSCGLDGTCDGAGACRRYPASSGCTPSPCTLNADCSSGYCVDGVCCNSPCQGECRACLASLKGTGVDGECGFLAAGTDPENECAADVGFPGSCLADGQCDGRGACRAFAPESTSCGTTTCSGDSVSGQICNGTGSCVTSTNSCAPYGCSGAACAQTCTSATDCASGYACSSNDVCVRQSVNGASCSSAGECESGYCVDGVCCDGSCDAACEACSAAGKGYGIDGVCEPVAAGQDPRDDCVSTAAETCGTDGACDGSGSCRLHVAGTFCADVSCSGNVLRGRTCDGKGECVNGTAETSCEPYVCSEGACSEPCADDSSCISGYSCQAGECRRTGSLGTDCSDAAQCSSGHCVDGYCCNSDCNGQCEACNVVGDEGSCLPVSGTPVGERPGCEAPNAECGSRCDGITRDRCRFVAPGTECGEPTCADGMAERASCDGAGSCVPEEVDCAPYNCAVSECNTRCSSDAQCGDGARCEAARCVAEAAATPQASEDEGGCGCRTAGAVKRDGTSALWMLSLLGFGWLVARRRVGSVAARGAIVVAVLALIGCGAEAESTPGPSPDAGVARAHGVTPSARRLTPVRAPVTADYAVTQANQHFVAKNPGQGLRVEFAEGGLAFEPAAGVEPWRFELSVAAYGCVGELSPLERTLPKVTDNLVRYERHSEGGKLEEWYLNRAEGIEQGFTIGEPPACARDGDAELVIEIDASAPGVVESDTTDARFEPKNGPTVFYTGLEVTDAQGGELPARLESTSRGLRIVVRARPASFPIEIDPLVATKRATLYSDDRVAGDHFGNALSLDGDLLVVGAEYDDDLGTNSGAAYVFQRSGSGWSQLQKLQPSVGGLNDHFGAAVHTDGTRIVVGAPDANGGAGRVFVYRLDVGTWVEEQMIGGLAGYRAGAAVWIDAGGILVGAPNSNLARAGGGAVFVLLFDGSNWNIDSWLLPVGTSTADAFGTSVAVDNGTLLVGAPGDDQAGTDAGAAYVFVGSTPTWTLQQKLVAGTPLANDSFGQSVAISGETAAVGAPLTTGGADVFLRSGTSWALQQELSSGANDRFGSTVALNGDELMVGVGELTAKYHRRAAGAWTEELGIDGAHVVLESQLAIAGAPLQSGGGAVFVYALDGGEPCTTSDTCATGYCVDGVCCSSACTGECQACSLAAGATADGQCSNIASDTICAPYRCHGSGKCYSDPCLYDYYCLPGYACFGRTCVQQQANGAECSSGKQCTSGRCIDGYCCDTLCNALCQSCAGADTGQADGVCAPILAGIDPANECVDDFPSCGLNGHCDGAGACQSYPDPTSCSASVCSQDGDCSTGYCVDGVCCDSACTGTCMACTAAKKGQGEDGVCDVIAQGSDPDDECERDPAYPASCLGNGTCDGGGACDRYAPSGTSCGASSCSDPGTLSQFTCNGAGACLSVTSSCAPYECLDAFVCATSCVASGDCRDGHFCSGGQCVAVLDLGAPCTEGSECGSGHCVDGVCCDTVCAGTCRACSAAAKGQGADGACDYVRSGNDPDDDCPTDAPGSCQLDGSCDGAGSCRYYPAGSGCGATRCDGTIVRGQVCDGAGQCVTSSGGIDCAPYGCGDAGCATSCASSADCTGDGFCDDGACLSKLANGEACMTSGQCRSGYCVDGVCCNSACTGQCEACDTEQNAGVCVAIQGEPHGNRVPCVGAGTTCSGSCNGSDPASCTYPSKSVKCGSARCVDGASASFACNGQGACVESARASCGGYACDGTRCGTRCASNDGCAEGYECSAQGSCEPRAGTCSEDGSELSGADWTRSCAPFRCDPTAGECLTNCAVDGDCLAGFTCDQRSKSCSAASAQALPKDEGGCGCRVPASAPSTPSTGWVWSLLGVGWLARRRLRRPRWPARLMGSATLLGLGLLAACGSEPDVAGAGADAGAVPTAAAQSPVATLRSRQLAGGTEYGLRLGTRTAHVASGRCPAQGLELSFRQSAVDIELQGARRLTLKLAAMGRGSAKAVELVTDTRVEGSEIFYHRGNVTEWYLNGPLGLEQGFDVAKRPDGDASQPVELRIAVGGNLDPVLEGDRVALYDREGTIVAYYGELWVGAADGEAAPARLAVEDRNIVLRIDDRGVRYPLHIDPLVWVQRQLITASDFAPLQHFGSAVSMDGDVALVGAPGDTQYGQPGGSYVFTRNGAIWGDEHKLVSSDLAAEDRFGFDVGLFGTTAIVGAPYADNGAGAAYVFVYDGSVWSEEQKLTAANGNLGYSVVAGTDDALIGAIGGNGSVYYFTRSGTTWTEQQELVASDGASNDLFGARLSRSANTLAIGAYAADPSGSSSGAVYVFAYDGANWVEQQKIVASDATNGLDFGYSVAVDWDGLLVGSTGGAYFFTRSGTTWTEQQKLSTNPSGGGRVVGLSGNVALLGAPLSNATATNSGAAYAFFRGSTGWVQDQYITQSGFTTGYRFGAAIAVSGGAALIGASHADLPSTGRAGKVFYYESRLKNGELCTSATECYSGLCVDGVCCNTACAGSCDVCDLAGSEGTCKPVDSSCGSGMWCNAGTCQAKKANGTACGRSAECTSTWCVDAVCCNTACDQACAACNVTSPGVCSPVAAGDAGDPSCAPYICDGSQLGCPTSCAVDTDCMADHYCAAGTCSPLEALGDACGGDNECTSGFCADGLCCDTACDEACDTCDVAGSEGTCSTAPAGRPGAPSCAPYLCDGEVTVCPDSCSRDLDCASTHYCVAGVCTSKFGSGSSCTENRQCQSGNCAAGLCCDRPCSEACAACDVSGSEGTCTAVPAGSVGAPRCAPYVCDGVSETCPGSCSMDGDCSDGYFCDAGVCAREKMLGSACAATNECRSGLCVDGYCCNAACDGECNGCDVANNLGLCTVRPGATSGQPSCEPYMCDGVSAACPSSCLTDAQCASGFWCDVGTCSPLGTAGTACTLDQACASGFCADGVCCETACGGSDPTDCQACSVAAGAPADGTCAPMTAGIECRASRGACDPAESCDGNSTACPVDALEAAGTECRAAAGDCDVAEACDGAAPDCPRDDRLPAGTTCRAAEHDCDAEERCDGSSVRCPTDGLRSDGARCDDGDECTERDTCEAGVCVGVNTCGAGGAGGGMGVGGGAGSNTAGSSASLTSPEDEGCGCRVAGLPRPVSGTSALGLLACGLLLGRRRRGAVRPG